ncbi:hypothetical protein ACOMHN_036815 [Nucella lapillus]
MTIRLRAKPFNITVAQVYAPTSDYDDKYIDNLKQKMQEVVEKVDIKDISIIQGSLNAKVPRLVDTPWHFFHRLTHMGDARKPWSC